MVFIDGSLANSYQKISSRFYNSANSRSAIRKYTPIPMRSLAVVINGPEATAGLMPIRLLRKYNYVKYFCCIWHIDYNYSTS